MYKICYYLQHKRDGRYFSGLVEGSVITIGNQVQARSYQSAEDAFKAMEEIHISEKAWDVLAVRSLETTFRDPA